MQVLTRWYYNGSKITRKSQAVIMPWIIQRLAHCRSTIILRNVSNTAHRTTKRVIVRHIVLQKAKQHENNSTGSK